MNQLIKAYNDAGLADKNLSASNTLIFINERLKLISAELGDVEKKVADYKSTQGITDISDASQLFLQNVQQNDTQLSQVKVQQSVLDAIQKQISLPNADQGSIPVTLMGVDDPNLLALMGQLSTLELQRQSTVKIVKPGNPIVQALDEQIATLKRNIFENINSVKNGLAITRQQLEKQSGSMNGLIKSVPVKERKLVDISRQQAVKDDLYTFLLKNREETALSFASTVSDTRTVDSAISSDNPIKPKKAIVLLVFALFGIILPFGGIYLLDLWNDKIKSRADVERETKVPILAEISQTTNEADMVLNLGRSAIAEQIRALRTNIAFLSPAKKLQVIMLTSSMSGEGKSFLSLNVGASLAITGKKVIIIEFDLRKPKLKEKLKIEYIKQASVIT